MKTIVCYGDSNTWGFKPEKTKPDIRFNRFEADIRWPGALQKLLGAGFRVEEEGLSGRTTAFDDPLDSRRNGLAYIDCCLYTHMPVDLVAFLLGTNDVKEYLGVNAFVSSCGLEQLIKKTQCGEYGPNGRNPEILVISPAHIRKNIENTWPSDEFGKGCLEKDAQLSKYYGSVAKAHNCKFMDAAEYVLASETDAVHLDTQNHLELARAVYSKILQIL